MKASRKLTAKKYKDDQKVKNTTKQSHIVEQLKIEDVESQEEQIKKLKLTNFGKC